MAKAERGDPSVSIGVYANALFALGVVERLGMVADHASDAAGLALDDERLPKRVRRPSPARSRSEGRMS
jgi:hypothetical protein